MKKSRDCFPKSITLLSGIYKNKHPLSVGNAIFSLAWTPYLCPWEWEYGSQLPQPHVGSLFKLVPVCYIILSSLSFVLVRASIAMLNSMIKSNLGRREFIFDYSSSSKSITEGSQGRNSFKQSRKLGAGDDADTEAKKQCCLPACFPELLSLLSYSKDPLPRGGNGPLWDESMPIHVNH